MKSSLTRSTAAGRAYLDLRGLAQRTGQLTDDVLQSYILEGFLARLSASKYSSQLVLKGGVLLAAYELRRSTRDIDIQASQVSNSLDEVTQIVTDIALLPREDGIDFDIKAIRAAVIREDDAYSGVRVRIDSRLATAKFPLHVDVNVGDPIWPPPRPVELPCLLGGAIKLVGYPIPMILAEKIVQLRSSNGRVGGGVSAVTNCQQTLLRSLPVSQHSLIQSFSATPMACPGHRLCSGGSLPSVR
jgi:hypothetical protein